MRHIQKISTILLLAVIVQARTLPGKSSFAARISNFSEEFGFGRMISPMAMVLIDGSLEYSSGRSESKAGANLSSGPTQSEFLLTVYPEYRFYILPRNRVVPYFGFYGVMGIGSSAAEKPTGTSITAENGSSLKLGAGASVGAEFFINRYISLAAHARLAQYTYETQKKETDTGFTLVENIKVQHRIGIQLEPGLYVRLYF